MAEMCATINAKPFYRHKLQYGDVSNVECEYVPLESFPFEFTIEEEKDCDFDVASVTLPYSPL